MRKRLVLVVDDEPPIARLVKAKLQLDGFAVVTAPKGEDALPIVERDRPDLVILDLMMPGMDGFETLRRIRERSRVPVIFLTARAGDADKLRGLQSGADDYITKPFNPDELVARVTAVLRRADGAAPAGGTVLLEYTRVHIDLDRRHVTIDGNEIKLSRTEWELLYQLASNAGRVMLHRELLSRIWGPEFTNEVQYLRTWVSRLRSKLDPDDTGELITTFPGVGYRMELPGAQQ
ncbi:MAG: response regulator transcription factor [Thermomicrobiales bacterium]|nr:response regulator transcription factor [Thermomicrobiales bacterium]